MLEFIYSDNLQAALVDRGLLNDLLSAADTYALPRSVSRTFYFERFLSLSNNLFIWCGPQVALCQQALGLGPQGEIEDPKNGSKDEHGDGTVRSTVVYVPPPSLSSDLGGALGDSSWSDVKSIAGGRPIHAHRCILCARSSFFAAMFRSGMQEGVSSRKCRRGLSNFKHSQRGAASNRSTFIYCQSSRRCGQHRRLS